MLFICVLSFLSFVCRLVWKCSVKLMLKLVYNLISKWFMRKHEKRHAVLPLMEIEHVNDLVQEYGIGMYNRNRSMNRCKCRFKVKTNVSMRSVYVPYKIYKRK